MHDQFKTLSLPRLAALDPEQIKAKFHEFSRDLHPDAGNTKDSDAFTQLNTAQTTLTRPSTRLRHLIELETGTPPEKRSAMSPDLMDLFSQIAPVLSSADHHLQRKTQTTTAVARAMLSKDAPEHIQSLMTIGGQLSTYRKTLESRLPLVDDQKNTQRLKEAATLAHEFAFIEKWQSQVQERMGNML